MTQRLKCGVIGVGYLGRFHAQKYHILPNVELVGVCDTHQETLNQVSNELSVPAYSDYKTLLTLVDAVSIATSTKEHFKIAAYCLSQGIHVLLEKPMTETLEEAKILIDLAKQYHVKLQIGHIEHFNAARLAIQPFLTRPFFIDAVRLAPFNARGADVNVILDLMIHDIDLIHDIVQSPITNIQAQGTPVITKAIDIATARIHFANGCIANITSSRISTHSERKTRIFQKDNYLSIDYQTKECAIFEKEASDEYPLSIKKHVLHVEPNDALLTEICSFINCIEHNADPKVSGEQGLAALSVAHTISQLIETYLIEINQ